MVGYNEQIEFKGLIPVVNKKFPVIGKEIEVVDIEEIMTPSKGEFNRFLNDEYKKMLEKYPNLYFWESHLTLNHKLEDVSSVKELKVLICENIYESGKYVYTITHNFETNETTETKKEDEWYNSRQFNPTKEVKISLEDALEAYEKSRYKTTGDKVTLRSPFIKPEILPVYYIIGQLNSRYFVKVDAITGEVSLM